jgi:hypothetical protein
MEFEGNDHGVTLLLEYRSRVSAELIGDTRQRTCDAYGVDVDVVD